MEVSSKIRNSNGGLNSVHDSALSRQDDLALGSFLDLMVDVFAETLQAERISILLFEPETGHLMIESSRGLSSKIVHATQIPPGEGIVGLAVAERVPLAIRSGDTPDYLQVPLDHPELAASFVIPIYHENHTLGAICAATTSHPECFTPRNMDWLIEVSNRLSPVLLSLQRQRRRQRTVNYLFRLMETIERLGSLHDEREAIDLALRSAGRICSNWASMFIPAITDEGNLKWETTVTFLAEPWTSEEFEYLTELGSVAFSRNRVQDRVVGLHSPQSVRISLEERGIERVLILPVQHGDKVLGLFYCFPPRGSRDVVRVLRFLASHLGGALSRSGHLRQLEKLAFMDELTGIYSRGYWMERFREEFSRAERSEQPLSVLLFDIDDFKTCNDTYGHTVGDVVLTAVAQVIGRSARHFDNVCRYGGEEFTVLLPGIDQDQALQIAERIRQNVAQQEVLYQDRGPGTMTVSGGVATFPVHATTLEGLLDKADLAMYQAKHEGKNRICLPDPINECASCN